MTPPGVQFVGVEDPTVRWLLTVGILAALGLSWLAVRRACDRLGDRFDARRVETVEMVGLTVLVGLTAVAIVLVWDAVTKIRSQLSQVGTDPILGVKIVVSLLFVAVAYGVVRIVSRVLRLSASDVPTDHRREVVYHVTQVVVFAIAGFLVLAVWGIDLGNLLVGAGFLGIVLGLAARQTLGAVIAGFVLLFSRPFEVGEWVEIGGQEGIVTDVTIFNTRLRTFDDEHVLIPNDRVTSREIVNRSREGQLRVTVEVGVDYETDVDEAMAVAEAAVESCERVVDSPSPHVVGKRFGDSAVVLGCRFWIADPSARRMWRARTEAVTAIKEAYEREGIPIPFPQRTLGARDGALPGGAVGQEGGQE